MNSASINYLNIGLMALAWGVALFLPFELFLFAYVVMGPLHYFTEIGWLHQRRYFTPKSNDYLVLLSICVLAFILYLLDGSGLADTVISSGLLRNWIVNLIVLAFVAALSIVVFANWQKRIAFTLLVAGGLLAVTSFRIYMVWLAMLLPTLIHVSIFTAAFMLFGAIKEKSKSGYLAVGVFALLFVSMFFVPIGIENYQVISFFREAFMQSDFLHLNAMILQQPDTNTGFLFGSSAAITLQRVIAFSYTYHYLNWFSKTRVINWHKVPMVWIAITVVGWITSVVLYLLDFKTGLTVLFFLSMLHVFLEFPLNHQSFWGIGRAIKAAVSNK